MAWLRVSSEDEQSWIPCQMAWLWSLRAWLLGCGALPVTWGEPQLLPYVGCLVMGARTVRGRWVACLFWT